MTKMTMKIARNAFPAGVRSPPSLGTLSRPFTVFPASAPLLVATVGAFVELVVALSSSFSSLVVASVGLDGVGAELVVVEAGLVVVEAVVVDEEAVVVDGAGVVVDEEGTVGARVELVACGAAAVALSSFPGGAVSTDGCVVGLGVVVLLPVLFTKAVVLAASASTDGLVVGLPVVVEPAVVAFFTVGESASVATVEFFCTFRSCGTFNICTVLCSGN